MKGNLNPAPIPSFIGIHGVYIETKHDTIVQWQSANSETSQVRY
jgi:hypothetical protein